MKTIIPVLFLSLCLPVAAQSEVHMPNPMEGLTRQQQLTLKNQALDFFKAVRPAVSRAARSTVILSYRGKPISYGTVLQSPRSQSPVILTKWSEISSSYKRLIVIDSHGKHDDTSLLGIYPEHDLAVLSTELKLTPLRGATHSNPSPGEFIALASPSGDALSLGVVSVKARSLRETDKAYLGVLMDFEQANQHGTPLEKVVPESPAASAGLRPGDVVTAIDRKEIKGALEMRNTLQKLVPGSEILVSYRRNQQPRQTKVKLGSRPADLDPRRIPQKRLDQMQRMGTVPNRVRQDFPMVIQSDLPIQADETPRNRLDNHTNECGGPVVDLKGRFVGTVIARGSRIKTFIIPADTLEQLLKTPPEQRPQSRGPLLLQRGPDSNPPLRPLRRLFGPRNSRQGQPPKAIPLDE